MTEGDVVKAVTARLTGELYVGQRVKVVNGFGSTAVVTRVGTLSVDILFADGITWTCVRSELEPAP